MGYIDRSIDMDWTFEVIILSLKYKTESLPVVLTKQSLKSRFKCLVKTLVLAKGDLTQWFSSIDVCVSCIVVPM